MALTIISGCGSQLFRVPVFVFTRYQNTDPVIKFYFQNTFVMKMNCGFSETKHKSSKGTSQPTFIVIRCLLMSLNHVSNT